MNSRVACRNSAALGGSVGAAVAAVALAAPVEIAKASTSDEDDGQAKEL